MEASALSAGDPDRVFEENLERYQVYSALEIGHILRGIQANRQLMRMSFSGTLETAITGVLDVDVEGKTMLLDMPPLAIQEDMALKSSTLSFEGVLDRIKISFTTGRAYRDTFNGAPALRAPFPERLVRLQRRNHFRVRVSGSKIRIPVEVDGNVTYTVCTVRDLSQNGACVIDTVKKLDDTVGRVYENCRLELPHTQPLLVTLEVRNLYRINTPDEAYHFRVGCRFVDLSSAEAALIQRYITREERKRRMLA